MPIYTKPLGALSFATQIGHIDAVTYCLGLQPPLPEPNDELMRLLSEALALANAEDSNLLGRAIHRQNSMALNRLRVTCIKLLTASMPVTDFFLRQPPVHQRAIGVYFKSLYYGCEERRSSWSQDCSATPNIGLNASSGGGSDTKSLSLDIGDLLLTWDKRLRTEQDSMDKSEDGSSRISAWTSPLSRRKNVVSYMLRLAATLPQEPVGAKNSLTQRAMNLLAFLLGPEGWPEVVVKITYFTKIFAALDFGEGGSPHALSDAKALALVLKDENDAYYVANAAIIQGLWRDRWRAATLSSMKLSNRS